MEEDSRETALGNVLRIDAGALLRHQLSVLRRQAPLKPRLTAADRLLFVWLCRLFPSLKSAITIVQPTPCCADIDRVSGCTGVESRGRAVGGPRSRRGAQPDPADK